MDLNTPSINQILDTWLTEDIGRGDLTTTAIDNQICKAYWLAKEKGVLCGSEIVKQLFKKLDHSVKINLLVKDGETFNKNQKILEIEGPAKTLLAGERTTLNLAMHLSGIATKTSLLVAELQGSGINLADTRKTTPGLRLFEKYAFRCGGGINHRFGLDDSAMLKENHLAWSQSIELSIAAIKKSSPWPTTIIVEAETPEQAISAVSAGADGILLDEISPQIISELVPKLRELSRQRSEGQTLVIEASGVDPSSLKSYCQTGIDLISTSAAVTKSHWIDLSMRFE